jgi:hypothetical protein
MQSDNGGGSATVAGRWGEEAWLRRVAACAVVVAASVAHTSPAAAFCRTTTCDPGDPDQNCAPDDSGCVREGLPLYWPERCLSFGVQQDGSLKQGIDYQTANDVITEAYRQWMAVDCQGAHPSFRVWDVGLPYGGIVCSEPEFNQNEPNANVWMFRDADWPYVGAASTLALTTITFEVPTGEILDADVEVNSFMIPLTTSEDHVVNDLLSIATHETGHFLGLAHSQYSSATMNANYSPGDLSFRTLEQDDIDGVCEIYPPDRDVPDCSSPRPRHGFTRFCADPLGPPGSCAVAPEPSSSKTAFAGVSFIAICLLGGRAARRRRR